MKNRHSFLALAILVIAGCGVPGPKKPIGTFNLDFGGIPAEKANGVVVFYVDGVNPFIFEDMLKAGELPAIAKYFVGRGLSSFRTVCNIPSVTLANETSFVTGLYPGHHGITGINWFDRNKLVWRNYETITQKNMLDTDHRAATIYEQFPDRTTMSLFFQAHRGASYFVENWMSAGPPFFFRWYEFVDRLTLKRLDLLIEIARKRGRFPAFTVVYLLAPDFRAYDSGVKSQAYRDAMKHTDEQIGRVLADMEKAGLLDKIHIAFVSDHSLTEVKQHFPLADFLRDELGISVAREELSEETSFRKRLDVYRKYSTVVYGSGDRYSALCLRKPIRREGKVTGLESWPIRPSVADMKNYPTATDAVDLPTVLSQQEAVDVVAYAVSPSGVRLVRKQGEVEFRQDKGRGTGIIYRVISGDDPLGWKRSGKVPAAMLTGKPHSPREWLEATVDTNYPGLPAQIIAYFRAHRAGDIAVFAASGWDFKNVNRAGHGGLLPEDMLVPMLLAGPGVPHKEIYAAQTIDLMPTVLKLLGRPILPGLDGTSLIGD